MTNFLVKLLLVVLAFFGIAAYASQSADQVKVTFAEPVRAGEVLLAPGDYSIRLLPVPNDSPVLIFENGQGEKVFVSASRATLPAGRVASQTELHLTREGDELRLLAIEVAGRPYFYQVSLTRPPAQSER